MNWGLLIAIALAPFYVGLVCWLARPLKRFIERKTRGILRRILLFSWRI